MKDAPLPWTITANSWQYTTIYDANGMTVCRLDLEDWNVTEDNQDALETLQAQVASLIVEAVNRSGGLTVSNGNARERGNMKHIFACGCGENTETTDRALVIGSVFECQKCSQVWGRVISLRGGTAWVKISDQEVDFYDLLAHRDDEADEIDFGLPAQS